MRRARAGRTSGREIVLLGVSAAPGVTIGPAVVLGRNDSRRTHEAYDVESARQALKHVASDLEQLASHLRTDGRGDESEIIEAGALMALDPELTARVQTLIADSGLAAGEALHEATEQTALELSRLADPTLAQRADDVRSIGRRAIAHLRGDASRVLDGVLVADSLGPADVAELAPSVRGIALAGGGITSHAAIVARSLGLPMVVGAGAELFEVEDGEELVVDGDHGLVVRGPDAERAALARANVDARRAAREIAIEHRFEPAQTKDGRRIRVLANASTVAELEEAIRQGAEGVGLVRTELLFLDATRWPSPDEQVNVLRPVLTRLQGQTATVRLFDFGADKTPAFLRGTAKRGIEILLDVPEVLRAHLRAVVQAGRGTQLRILVPMVSSADQMSFVRQALDADAQVGAMIETRKAAEAAEQIAQQCDFLSIGTNDLTQLVLGLDREQSRKAPVLDQRVLTLIARTMRAGRVAHIPVDVCGEAASDAKSLPVMVGFGADELSVAPARVGQVRQWVRELSFESCRTEAKKLLDQAGHASRKRV
ncbi:MAG TPA: phosphoenolpyruvate--protein phosphotransferase [Candidatus Dormibacteraeota bacterium]|nr:phosphoenolpyruvate--protein phosphotransferase [Candidatus Dormibacteraeota bacterium]